MTPTLAAMVWFGISLITFVIGAYVAIFTVTTYRGRHALVATAFIAGAFVDLVFILILVLRPT
jgi:hypothetical protein